MEPRQCTIHPHSTKQRAIKCRAKMMGYRADKTIERNGSLHRRNVDMIRHLPPRQIFKDGIEYWVFYEDGNMPY